MQKLKFPGFTLGLVFVVLFSSGAQKASDTSHYVIYVTI